MSIVAFSDTLGAVVPQFLFPELLKTPTPTLIAGMNASLLSLPYRSGTQLLQVQFQNLPPAVNTIANGTSGPPPVYLQRNIISTTVNLTGSAIFMDTKLQIQDQLDWAAGATERIVFAVRQGQDLNYYASLMAGASFYSCLYGGGTVNPTPMSNQDGAALLAAFQNNNAPFVGSVMHGTLQFNTSPQNQTYIAISNPIIIPNLTSLVGFSQTGSYPIQNNERGPGEFGVLSGNFRYFTSSNTPVSPTASSEGTAVAISFFMGEKPYCGVALDSDTVNFLYRPPIFSNAYGLQVSFGATLYFGSSVTQDDWVLQVLSSGAAPYIFGNPYL